MEKFQKTLMNIQKNALTPQNPPSPQERTKSSKTLEDPRSEGVTRPMGGLLLGQ